MFGMKKTAYKATTSSSEDESYSASSSPSSSSSSSSLSEVESEESQTSRLCKFGCSKKCNPGLTARGNPFDTCCKSCAVSKGNPMSHDFECDSRNGILYGGKSKKKSFKKRMKKRKIIRKKKKAFKRNFYSNTNNNNSFPWNYGNNAVPALDNTFTNTPLSSFGNNQNSFVGMSDLSAPTKRINYLELDDWMISLDDASLNRLTTAQLIQRLRSNGLDYKGMKHELIERWKKFKMGKPKTGVKLN